MIKIDITKSKVTTKFTETLSKVHVKCKSRLIFTKSNKLDTCSLNIEHLIQRKPATFDITDIYKQTSKQCFKKLSL